MTDRPRHPDDSGVVTDASVLMVTYQDNAGVSRIKVLPADRVGRAGEVGCTVSLSAGALFSTDDYPVSTAALDATVGDLRAIPDLAAAAELDGGAGLWWAPADLVAMDGTPFVGCQRSLLRRVVADARDAGFEPLIGMELEFTLFTGSKEAPVPAHVGPGYGTLAFVELEAFHVAVLAALRACGVPVEQIHPEYAKGQVEISLAPAPPVEAVDRSLLTRLVVTRVALAHGLLVSFAPIAIVGEVGNGLHIHLSASRDGCNVFHDPVSPTGLATAGRQMLAGVVDSLVDAVALLGGTTVSFARLQPKTWAGAYACWGDGNREAAVRLMRGFAGFEAKQSNIEIKCADGGSNQYVAVTAILASALRGVELDLPLPPEVTVDPSSLTAAERDRAGVRQLPADLGAALDALEQSEFFRQLLGDVLFDTYVAVRRREWAVHGPLTDDLAVLVAANRWRQ